MSVYYNEIEPFAAAWLRALIAEGVLPDGEVDTRSIVDVQPADVRGFVQCHWFAGIGGWAWALQLAGWPADRPLWTGSCPCQPFSAAGAQAGGDDARDLWPAWARLIRECRPDVVAGEQVESAIAHGWLDRVADDLEREGYALGAVCLPAAGVGAYHIRQRLWFVADAGGDGAREHARELSGDEGAHAERAAHGDHASGASGTTRGLADPDADGRQEQRLGRLPGDTDASCRDDPDGRGAAGAVGDTQGAGLEKRELAAYDAASCAGPVEAGAPSFWSAVEWIPCVDGKARPVEPGTFPLADGVPARVGRLRGYGNAIVAPLAAEVLRAYLEVRADPASGEAW